MNITRNKYAYSELFLHIRELVAEAYAVAGGKKPNSKYYPPISVACEYTGVISCKDTSKNPTSISFNDDLRARLEDKLAGNIGERSGPNNYVIGVCAEQVAANDIMRKIRVQDIPDLTFTEAFQPRTMKMRDWCYNCHQVFD